MPVAFLMTGYYRHPKLLAAGEAAEVLWARALDYTAEHGTEGKIPTGAPGLICPIRTQARIDALVKNKLWEPIDGGWLIHNYLVRNRTELEKAARREAISKARSEAGKKGADTRWEGTIDRKGDGKADNNGDGNSHSKPGGKALAPDSTGPGPGPGPEGLGFSRSSTPSSVTREQTRGSTQGVEKTDDQTLADIMAEATRRGVS